MGPDQEVMFERERITLDIPKEGVVLESGWTITPHTYPGVSLLILSVCQYELAYRAQPILLITVCEECSLQLFVS